MAMVTLAPQSATLLLAGTDCDDSNAAANTGQVELCSTDFDDDCDGFVNDDSAIDVTVFYQDSDGDGFGDPDVEAYFCELQAGFSEDSTDCDDTLASVNQAKQRLWQMASIKIVTSMKPVMSMPMEMPLVQRTSPMMWI